MEEGPDSDQGGEALRKAEDAVKDLFHFRDHYFEINSLEKASEKPKELASKLKETTTILDSIQGSIENTAKYYCLYGRALNVVPSFDPKAQEFLTKAVKTEPKLVEAWNSLGECYWKNGDVESAKNCFAGALNHAKNKVSLRNLSMAYRQLGKDEKERMSNVKESVESAKEAVSLDIHDGISWYILGNAYLSLFFNGSQSPQTLKQCMSAYLQAERDPVAANNSDLHFNRATAYKYQEEYRLALDGFTRAAALDPAWNDPREEKTKLLQYLDKTMELIKTKGKLKTKRLQSMVQSITEKDLGLYGGGSYTSPTGKTVTIQKMNISQLKPDINLNKVVAGKVVGVVPIDQPVPFTLIMVDSEGTCVAVTIYNMALGSGLAVGDSLAIPEPFVQVTNLTEEGKEISLTSIRVDNPVVMIVNKKKVGVNRLAPSTLSVTAMSEG